MKETMNTYEIAGRLAEIQKKVDLLTEANSRAAESLRSIPDLNPNESAALHFLQDANADLDEINDLCSKLIYRLF